MPIRCNVSLANIINAMCWCLRGKSIISTSRGENTHAHTHSYIHRPKNWLIRKYLCWFKRFHSKCTEICNQNIFCVFTPARVEHAYVRMKEENSKRAHEMKSILIFIVCSDRTKLLAAHIKRSQEKTAQQQKQQQSLYRSCDRNWKIAALFKYVFA